MSRYSDIRRGAQLNQALTRYTSYLTTPRTSNVNSRGALDAQQTVGVVPFDLDITGDYVAVRSPVAGVSQLKDEIDGVTGLKVLAAADLNSKTAQAVTGFKPARVVTFQNATRAVTVATSDVTSQQYLKYSGDRFSCAFGRATKTGTGKMVDLFDALKVALKARTGLAVNRVSLTPERYSFR